MPEEPPSTARDATSKLADVLLAALAAKKHGKPAEVVKKAFEPGQEVPGYRLLELVAEGGQGAVFRALDLEGEVIVALKILPCALEGDDSRREVKHAKGINHRNVCRINGTRVVEVEPYGAFRFIEMEYIAGGTLADRMTRKPPLDPHRAMTLFRGIAAGIEEAHRHGVLHLDLKPSNVLLRGAEPVVSDFGIASTLGGEASGHTPGWTAPEVERGDARLDQRADVYSLGVLIERLFVERSASLNGVIAKAKAEDPADRFATVEDLRDAVDDAQRIVPDDAPTATEQPLPKRVARRWIAGAAVLTVLATVGSLVGLRIQRERALVEAAQTLRVEYQKVVSKQQTTFSESDFAAVNAQIDRIVALDGVNNGHALYYTGQKRRWMNSLHRDGNGFLSSHDSFNLYLEEAKRAPVPRDSSPVACYEQAPHGYCVERTAWIHHLLAVDAHRSGCASTSQEARQAQFASGLQHAKAAIELNGGFNDPSQKPATTVVAKWLEEGRCDDTAR